MKPFNHKKIPLRAARAIRGRLLVDVAAEIGVTPAALSYWERGDRRPTPSNLRKLGKALGFPVHRLLLPDDNSG